MNKDNKDYERSEIESLFKILDEAIHYFPDNLINNEIGRCRFDYTVNKKTLEHWQVPQFIHFLIQPCFSALLIKVRLFYFLIPYFLIPYSVRDCE